MGKHPLDLTETAAAICHHYGLDLNVVASIRIMPTTAEIVTYLKNENGNFYIDQETDEAAADTHRFPITINNRGNAER